MIRAAITALCLIVSPAAAGAAKQPAEAPRVTLSQGTLSGVHDDGVERFLNIPYAAAPVGGLRWQPPRPPEAWQGVRDATIHGPACPQPVRPAVVAGGVADNQSEDCLALNIWRPATAERLPVLVWIHGGAHVIGSGGFPAFDGTHLARQGMIVVTLNYRLGLLGYFAHPALTAEAHTDAPLGNYGLMDQLAALQWVQDNIAAFGGDPGTVTLMGESAGAISINAILTLQAAHGLFHRAILQSGIGLLDLPSLGDQESAGMEAVGIAGLAPDASADDLRTLPVEAVLAATGPRSGGAIGPMIDGRLLRDSPWRAFARGAAIDVPLLIGANSNEASVVLALGVPLSAAWAYAGGDRARAVQAYGADLDEDEIARQILGDAWFVAPARWMAGQTATGAPSWLYHFDYVATERRDRLPGAAHGSEIPYIFGTMDYLDAVTSGIGPEDRTFSRAISACWSAFIITGEPACELMPGWLPYSPATDQLALFAAESRTVENFRKAQMDLLIDVRFGRPD